MTFGSGRIKRFSFGLIAYTAVLFIGLIDYLTGYNLSLSIFYLIPLFFATWHVGRVSGVFMAFLIAAIWTGTNILLEKPYAYWITPYFNFCVRTALFTVFSLLLSRLKIALEKEEKFSRFDFATDVLNQKGFYEIAKRELDRSRRFKRPLALAYIDFDNFKYINDTKGHQAGDVFLRSAAKLIQSNVRSIDIVARVGGDEFIVLLTETDLDGAQTVVERVRERLDREAEENKWPITCSIGVAIFTWPPVSVDDMIKRSDELMYKAKKEGKNTAKYLVIEGVL